MRVAGYPTLSIGIVLHDFSAGCLQRVLQSGVRTDLEGSSDLLLLMKYRCEGGTLGHRERRLDQLLRDLVDILHAKDLHT